MDRPVRLDRSPPHPGRRDLKPPLDVVSRDATEIASLIRRSELSAREVVERHIATIGALGPRLNALVVPLFDEARAQASAADEAVRNGDHLGPLHGVPVTIKESFRR